MAAWTLHVPAIRTLFEQVVTPSNVRGLGLEEVLNWTAETLNRVEPEKFFERFEREHAVQYFYEPFLEAFDPGLRKQLGVWYTPEEIVCYMVERTDRVLREELKIEAGLADERVYVLDPCCGTGAYLVEVLRRIRRTIDEQGGDALAAHDLKRAATRRVFGFEILPAPFVVAHLQLGLLLQAEGAPLAEGERVGVYLTNALTGWEPPAGPKKQIPFAFHALEEERDAAEHVKRETPILVVIGNPPYNAFAGVSTEQEGGLVEAYKEGLIKEWGIRKFNLDDLYVRFFRLAERRIAEQTGQGVVCFISNYSWTSEPSFVVLRRRLLESFDKFWVENMHGNRKISEYAPDGRTSETIFAIKGFSPGIQQGVVISTWVKTGEHEGEASVLYRDDLNAAKAEDRRGQLLDSLDAADFDAHYTPANPDATNRYSFRPSDVSADYLSWPKLTYLCAEQPSNGLMEKRGGALIDIDRAALEQRMRMYFDPDVGWQTLEELGTGLTEDAAGYEPQKARKKLLKAEEFNSEMVRRYALRPFDTRFCYYSATNPLWNRARPTLWAHHQRGNSYLTSRPAGVASPEGVPLYFTSALGDNDALRGHAYYFPLQLYALTPAKGKSRQQDSFFADANQETRPNLSPRARAYLAALGVEDVDGDAEAAALVWYHALAVGYSPAYLSENADGIRSDFPRVPLPATRELLAASAALGRQVAALLDTERAVPGVTSGAVRPELRAVAVLRRTDGSATLDPEAGDLELRAGWGHKGKGGVVMPGKGRAQGRDFTAAERAQLGVAAERLGPETFDIFLNDTACWSNVPRRVWDFHVGGYQIVKKWLSYREREILGRSLTPAEAREVTQTARRLAALVLLETELDANYERVKAASRPLEETA